MVTTRMYVAGLLIVSLALATASLSDILHPSRARTQAASCPDAASPEGSCGAASLTASTDATELSSKGARWGAGGELQQDGRPFYTTNFGSKVPDDENSLHANERGPTLLEDHIMREKITHFDHERIPERVVHARGTGAHGVYETTNADYIKRYSKASLFQTNGEQVETFVRFSTVAGPRGSVDTPRDVRGFATRFYTKEGNWDIVGNNIPVFFIQDAMKFPDLAHAVKQEPDRGFPTAASAHDNFWDWISLMPESMHMIQWAMSDRAIPRSYRTMEGFGVNTYRLIPAEGNATFVKFHWKPRLGVQSTVWDEALKLQGANNDYHRQDLWDNIEAGSFPEWDLGVQVFSDDDAKDWGFDYLDATKLIPEELVPVVLIGKMTLNRNVGNFFEETEQVAYCVGNIVPGIDFSNDPLLHGRLHSYLDTQLLRLGGPNFHQIPINQPRCPFFNLQQDGFHRQTNRKGRTNYSPNSRSDDDLATKGDTRQASGINSERRAEAGTVARARSASFADHYTQARLFYLSQTETEQNHIALAFIFELSKVEEVAIRSRIVSHLLHVDESLAARVAAQLGLDIASIAPAPTLNPAQNVTTLSPKLSIIASMGNNTFQGRMVGVLVTDGANGDLVNDIRSAFVAAGAMVKIVAPHAGSVTFSNISRGVNARADVDFYVQAGHSSLFDAVAIVASADGGAKLAKDSAALSFTADAWSHLKVIAYTSEAEPLLRKAGVDLASGDAGLIALSGAGTPASFLDAAKAIKVWLREPNVRNIP